MEQGPQDADVVVLQLLIGAPDDQQPDAVVAQGQQDGLGADGPAFAAAPRPAEGGVLDGALQEPLLLLVGVGKDQVDGLRLTVLVVPAAEPAGAVLVEGDGLAAVAGRSVLVRLVKTGLVENTVKVGHRCLLSR